MKCQQLLVSRCCSAGSRAQCSSAASERCWLPCQQPRSCCTKGPGQALKRTLAQTGYLQGYRTRLVQAGDWPQGMQAL